MFAKALLQSDASAQISSIAREGNAVRCRRKLSDFKADRAAIAEPSRCCDTSR